MVNVVYLPLTGTALKKCSKCEKLLPRSEYGKNRQARDGLNWHCLPCNRDYQKEKAARGKAATAAPLPQPVLSIVDQAKLILRERGRTDRAIDIMGLDAVMTEANRLLHRAGRPQLGRKAEWLVK